MMFKSFNILLILSDMLLMYRMVTTERRGVGDGSFGGLGTVIRPILLAVIFG